jgi:hypothetical protein
MKSDHNEAETRAELMDPAIKAVIEVLAGSKTRKRVYLETI